jgi:GNAT superfamily N-acetyltransferase
MRWTVRIATPVDEAAASALLHASYAGLLAAHYDRQLLGQLLPLIGRAQPALLASGTFFVAEDETGALLGCGGWTSEVPGTQDVIPGEAHVRHFATHPQAVRKGIGGALLNRCIEEARQSGNSILHADAALNAEPFYAAFGFRTVGLTEGDMPGALKCLRS